MAFLTIFSAPKSFTNPHIATIQRNAIQSWTRLGDEVEVLLVGDEPGMADIAQDYNIRQLPQVQRNEQSTPLVSSIFDLACQASDSPLLMYTNADMLFLPNLLVSLHQVAQQAESFLIVGQRWDLAVTIILDFSTGWEQRLVDDIHSRGRLHGPSGSDFFIFPRTLLSGERAFKMPEFAIGRAGWDNWMIFHARQQGWPVVDATPSITAIHQDHDYSHLPGGRPHYELPESNKNQQLAGGSAHMFMVLDCNWELSTGKLRRPRPTLLRLLRRGEVWLTPRNSQRKGARWALARRFRQARRRISGTL
jgi:hypothetical protein